MAAGWCHVWGGPAAKGLGGGGGATGVPPALKRQEELIYLRPTCWEYNSADGWNWLNRELNCPLEASLSHARRCSLWLLGSHSYPLRSIQSTLEKRQQSSAMCVNPPGLCLRRSSSSSWCRSWSSPGCQTGSWAGASAARTGRAAGGGGGPAAGCRCCWSGRSWRSAGWCRRRSAAASWQERKSTC